MIALNQNVANCQNTLTVLTLRWRIFPQDISIVVGISKWYNKCGIINETRHNMEGNLPNKWKSELSEFINNLDASDINSINAELDVLQNMNSCNQVIWMTLWIKLTQFS